MSWRIVGTFRWTTKDYIFGSIVSSDCLLRVLSAGFNVGSNWNQLGEYGTPSPWSLL